MTAARIALVPRLDAQRCLVLRRGPSAVVEVCLWHLDTDRVERGQWLRGRIYEDRCDLGPDGETWVYMAADFAREVPVWTCVAKAPYLTALAFFDSSAIGHTTYCGGGSFTPSGALELPACLELKRGGLPPRIQRVASGRWGPSPIQRRLAREGWVEHGRRFTRASAWGELSVVLTGSRAEFSLAAQPLRSVTSLSVDVHGGLLLADAGRLLRVPADRPLDRPILVADLNRDRFEPHVAPHHATRW